MSLAEYVTNEEMQLQSDIEIYLESFTNQEAKEMAIKVLSDYQFFMSERFAQMREWSNSLKYNKRHV